MLPMPFDTPSSLQHPIAYNQIAHAPPEMPLVSFSPLIRGQAAAASAAAAQFTDGFGEMNARNKYVTQIVLSPPSLSLRPPSRSGIPYSVDPGVVVVVGGGIKVAQPSVRGVLLSRSRLGA